MVDVAIVCPVSPYQALDGQVLAVRSDIAAIRDNGWSVRIVAFADGDGDAARGPSDVELIPMRRGSDVTRVARALLSTLPPSVERLYHDDARARLRELLKRWQPRVVILDETSLGGYIPMVREILPSARIILRTMNVMKDLRAEQLARSQRLYRLPLWLEYQRYTAFERRTVRAVDAVWAITESDAARTTEICGRPCDVLSVSIDGSQYASCATGAGDPRTFVHVGTVDFRRKDSLFWFVESAWPALRTSVPGARALLAGRVYGQPVAAEGVDYLGIADSDADTYRRGLFALNFQRSSGGIKLKTLTALAAGRTLVTTAQGAEGIPIRPGIEYVPLEECLANGEARETLRDLPAARRIAEAGREYLLSAHSRRSIAARFDSLLTNACGPH